MALSLNEVDPGCMNSITGSTCRAKCSSILHDMITVLEFSLYGAEGLVYAEINLMSLLCSGSTLCHTSLGQTFGRKYGSTLYHPCVVG